MSRTLPEIEELYYTSTSIDLLAADIDRCYVETAPNSLDRAHAAILRATLAQNTGSSAEKGYFEEALRIGTEYNDSRVLADAIHGMAIDAFRIADFKSVSKFEEEALVYATAANHQYRIASSLYMLGTVASNYGSHDDAVEFYGRSQRVALKHGFLKLQVLLLSSLSELCLKSSEFERARNYALSAIAIAKTTLSLADLLRSNVRLATIELELKHYDEVLRLVDHVDEALPKPNSALECTILTLRGQVHAGRSEWEEADATLRAALALATYPKAERVRSNIYYHLAELYEKQGKPDAALAEALRALEAANISNDSYVKKEALRVVHRCYKAVGNIVEAHRYLEEYNALVSAGDEALLKTRLEYHALRNELDLERAKAEEGKRQSDLLRIELEHKERELTERTRHLIKQMEALAQFRDDLQEIVRRSPVTDPVAHAIQVRLRSLPDSELHWQDFDAQFKLVHPEFLSKLETRYPALTPMERKICALLRLDLSSPEIAKLLFLSERNIQNHRYRLRKKLALASDANIHEFLAKL